MRAALAITPVVSANVWHASQWAGRTNHGSRGMTAAVANMVAGKGSYKRNEWLSWFLAVGTDFSEQASEHCSLFTIEQMRGIGYIRIPNSLVYI